MESVAPPTERHDDSWRSPIPRQTSKGCCARSILWAGRTGDGTLEENRPYSPREFDWKRGGNLDEARRLLCIFSRCSELDGAMKCFSIRGLQRRLRTV